MKLLIVTQKVDKNDPILGFFHRWVEEFSKYTEKLTVICLELGEYDLPENVEVYSLGKEKRKTYPPTSGLRSWVADSKDGWKLEIFTEIWVRILYTIRFYTLIWKMRAQYDSVFVHMNPAYIVLGGLHWRILGKRIGLWYTHRQVDLKLRIAEFFVHTIFTASKESFRLKSKKVLVTGHGLDIGMYTFHTDLETRGSTRFLTVGRISPTKQIKEMIDCVISLPTFQKFTVVGDVGVGSDKSYKTNLPTHPKVIFTGALKPIDTVVRYKEADIFLNASLTGSLDKAVLEAMLMHIPVLSSNEAFRSMLDPFGLFIQFDKNRFTKDVERALLVTEEQKQKLREHVVKNHSLESLIPRLVNKLSS